MPNTRSAAKRDRTAARRNSRNQIVRSATRTAVKKAVTALSKKDVEGTKESLKGAISALTRAASKGVIPARRAARKISRLTALAKKETPEALK